MEKDTLKSIHIPFNKPYLTGRELSYISMAHLNGKLAGDGTFTKRCQSWLEGHGNTQRALLTHSCTAALEMAAILCDIGPGDEIIMPSYTFVSTANAFVARGATPVFVDIRPDTLNLDESKIEAAITERTKAIVPVHYSGVACDMDKIMSIAHAHGLYVIEDAAQALLSRYKGQQLGTIGHLGCFSFHETKNVICGEGGALMVNDPELVERAEIIREKGTDRSKFLRGEVDKYTWRDIGSSFLPGELIAAFLWAQMESAEEITRRRLQIWSRYDAAFSTFNENLVPPTIPYDCTHNAHMYYLLNRTSIPRDELINELKLLGIHALFHYVPLHSSPFGMSVRNVKNPLPVTDRVSAELIRLPLYVELSVEEQNYVISSLKRLLQPEGKTKTSAHVGVRVSDETSRIILPSPIAA